MRIGEEVFTDALAIRFGTHVLSRGQAHDFSVRAIQYTSNGNFIVSADDGGRVNYFRPNLEKLINIQAHKESVRGLALAPGGLKFATASDDSTIKVRGRVVRGIMNLCLRFCWLRKLHTT